MTQNTYTETAARRNILPTHNPDHDRDRFTRGGWAVHLRTGWGASLANVVAMLAGIGGQSAEG